MHEQARGVKPRSVNGCLRSLKAMLNYFIGEDVLTASPMKVCASCASRRR